MTELSRRSFLRKMVLADDKHSNSGNTLVCVFLRGGADTLNMLIPYGDEDYFKVRPTIAIPRYGKGAASAIKLDDFYALHPALAPLLPIFRDGRMSVVQGVGTDNTSGSHFEAQDQFEQGEAYGKSAGGGWLGRYLHTRAEQSLSPLSAVSIGTSVPESLRGAPTATALTSIGEMCLKMPSADLDAVTKALNSLYGAEVGLLGSAGKDALLLNSKIERLRGNLGASQVHSEFPSTDFGQGLYELCRLVRAGVGLEVATIDFGGWDTHFYQGASEGIQASLMTELASGLAAFDRNLGSFRKKVTTIVVTEFGRRMYENGSQGTDHGRAFALFAMGAGVSGGRIIGAWSGFQDQDLDFLGPAGLHVGFDYRAVLAEILTGCLSAKNLDVIFPGYKPASVGLAVGHSA